MLDREEYVEQAHFFKVLGERLPENVPLQELLGQVRNEALATTNLPLAIDYMLSELKHSGVFAPAMKQLEHYFTPFQTYLVGEAENEIGRFDMRVALEVLRQEAEYRSKDPTPQGVFMYHFETLCRNRLQYDPGLAASAADPMFDDQWREWILNLRRQIGMVDIADLIYVSSLGYRSRGGNDDHPQLFGQQEGKIALASRKKDPLYLFSALQRQLGYPAVPRPKPLDDSAELLPRVLRRLERMESRLKLLEEEQRGGIDITKFYGKPPTGSDDSGP